ncbi:jerky protein homolog-like [Musca vetustissima]|uniref:jerky protein homolog-like n=1 Tax=Musca vetustissima TaxID=27455 RepID=UPI002AB6D445|nr:jerky protein homolog-like [Musca vetustissima]
MRGQNAVVTGLMLLNKAKEFAVKLEKDFEPNTSWLFHWKKRNKICVGKISGESKDSDEYEASNFIHNQLPKIVQEYAPEYIFNGDESGLYYKALPNTTYFNKGSPPKGWKMEKSRLTLLFICNSTGSYKRVFQHYRQIIVKKQICAIERGKTVSEYIKSITILDALHFIKRAWWLVKPECIGNCFKKAGFNQNRDTIEIEEEENCVSEVLTFSSEYQHCDDELICYGMLNDADILDDVVSDKSVEECHNNFN